MVDPCEGLFHHLIAMIVRPTTDNRIEPFYQIPLRHAGGALDNRPDLAHECCHVFLGRLDEKFPIILAYGPAEEVKTFLGPHDTSLFC